MPSASTTSPLAAFEAIESSLWERTIPGSVQLAISRACVRSMRRSELNIHPAAAGPRGGFRPGGGGGGGRGPARRGAASEGGAQRRGKLLPGLEALVGILRHGAREERRQPRRQVGPDRQQIGGRLVGDLEHEVGPWP